MPKVTFHPSKKQADVPPDTKILLAAKRAQQEIIFGCASCRCGTCGIRADGSLKPMNPDEASLLTSMHLPTNQNIRLACQARVGDGDVDVYLDFQNQYSPDRGIHG